MTESWHVQSPSKMVQMAVSLDDATGELTYTVKRGASNVLAASCLGIVRSDAGFLAGLRFESATAPATIDETYHMVHGKAIELRNRANERTLTFVGANGHQIELLMRAYDDGIAFRYRFPGRSDEPVTVTAEATSFNFASPGIAWMQPTQDPDIHAPSYENLHSNSIPIGTEAPGPAWNLPALFRSGEHWVLVTESDVDGSYFGAHLGAQPKGMEYQVVLPRALDGNGVGSAEPSSRLPWTMPWRAVIVSPGLSDVVESGLASHLSRGSEVEDISWITPGRVAWSWWSDVDSPQNLDALRTYVDFAAEIGWEHTLIDANWTVHSEAEIRALVTYAAKRGIGVFLWYNSGGSHNVVTEEPRDLMANPDVRRAEMKRISDWDVVGMKVDFFHSDKQVGIQLIEDIVRDAADYQLMVNLHGCTVPRGWTRRWPHLMTMEAVPGAEQYIFAPRYPEAAPANNTVLPFTRNAIGPMDYTPVTLSDQAYPHLTTAAHELALAVVFESGLQHFADSVDSYRAQPPEVWDFLSSMPVVWDETRLIEGWPGEYVVLARRRNSTWYVAGINGQETERTLELTLSFVSRTSRVLVITDGTSRDDITTVELEGGGTGHGIITMAPYGGFAIRAASL